MCDSVFDTTRRRLGLSKQQLHSLNTIRDKESIYSQRYYANLLIDEYNNWRSELTDLVDAYPHLTLDELAEVLGMHPSALRAHWRKYGSQELLVGYGERMTLLVRPQFIQRLFELNDHTFDSSTRNSAARNGILALPFLRWLELTAAERTTFIEQAVQKLDASSNRALYPLWQKKEKVHA